MLAELTRAHARNGGHKPTIEAVMEVMATPTLARRPFMELARRLAEDPPRAIGQRVRGVEARRRGSSRHHHGRLSQAQLDEWAAQSRRLEAEQEEYRRAKAAETPADRERVRKLIAEFEADMRAKKREALAQRAAQAAELARADRGDSHA